MKNNMRKILSLTLAGLMTLSTATTAFANEIDQLDGDANPTPLTGAGEAVTIDDDDITLITLPTDDAFDFIIDPLGLTTIEDGGSALLGELQGGRISLVGDAPAFINNSGFDVEIDVEIAITSDEIDNFVTATTDLVVANEANALVYLQPSVSRIHQTEDAYDNFVPTTDGIVITNNPSTLTFALPAAAYRVTNTGGDFAAAVVPNTGFGSALMLGGYVDSNADYSDATDVAIALTFTVAKKAVAADTNYDESGAYGLVVPASPFTTVVPHVLNIAPSAFASTSIWSPMIGGDVIWTIHPGSGALAVEASTLDLAETSITITVDGDAMVVPLSTALGMGVTMTNGVVTIPGPVFGAADANSSVVLKAVFAVEGTDPDLTHTSTITRF